MYLLECFSILFWMLIVPVLFGELIVNQLFKEKKAGFLLTVVTGTIAMIAVFYVLVMPMLFLKLPLHVLIISWSILMASICLFSLFANRKQYKEFFRNNFKQRKSLSLFAIFILLLIMAQAFFLVTYQHEDSDDAFFVASASTALTTDSIFQYDPYTGLPMETYPARYVMSPFPIFIAVLSKLVLIHPTIIAHTILPAVLIPFSYVIFAILSKKLFPDRPNAVLYFLLFLCVLNIFGNTSVYTNSTFLLLRIWQGKAILANIVLPAILYFSLRTMPGKKRFGEWMMLFACALSACLVSSTGIILAPIMIASLGLVFAFHNRKICTFVYSIACCTPCIACGIISIIR